MTELSTVEARERFAEVVNRAAFGRERVVLTRRGKPLAAVVPIEDFEWLRRAKDGQARDAAEREQAAHASERANLLTEQTIAAVRDVCRRHPIRELAIFGSALRDDFRGESDIDLLVEFEPGAPIGLMELGRIQQEFEKVFGRDVDLVPKAGLRLFLRDDVLSTARVLYDAA